MACVLPDQPTGADADVVKACGSEAVLDSAGRLVAVRGDLKFPGAYDRAGKYDHHHHSVRLQTVSLPHLASVAGDVWVRSYSPAGAPLETLVACKLDRLTAF
jgi:hypothetical protein